MSRLQTQLSGRRALVAFVRRLKARPCGDFLPVNMKVWPVFLLTLTLLGSFLEEVLASGFRGRSGESSHVTPRSSSRR